MQFADYARRQHSFALFNKRSVQVSVCAFVQTRESNPLIHSILVLRVDMSFETVIFSFANFSPVKHSSRFGILPLNTNPSSSPPQAPCDLYILHSIVWQTQNLPPILLRTSPPRPRTMNGPRLNQLLRDRARETKNKKINHQTPHCTHIRGKTIPLSFVAC